MKRIVEYIKRAIDWCVERYDNFLKSVYSLPGTRVDRELFCRKNFSGVVTEEELQSVIDKSPYNVCPLPKVDTIANRTIRRHCLYSSLLSFATAIPSGWLITPMIILDILQFQTHIFILSQKLLYLYKDKDSLSEYRNDTSTRLMLLMSTVMIGKHRLTNMIKSAVGVITKKAIQRYGMKVMARMSVLIAMRQIAKWFGITLTKEIFMQALELFILILCAVISGLITYWLFRPMAKKLQNHLHGEYEETNAEPTVNALTMTESDTTTNDNKNA